MRAQINIQKVTSLYKHLHTCISFFVVYVFVKDINPRDIAWNTNASRMKETNWKYFGTVNIMHIILLHLYQTLTVDFAFRALPKPAVQKR